MTLHFHFALGPIYYVASPVLIRLGTHLTCHIHLVFYSVMYTYDSPRTLGDILVEGQAFGVKQTLFQMTIDRLWDFGLVTLSFWSLGVFICKVGIVILNFEDL